MVNEADLMERLAGRAPAWELLVELEASAPAAAKLMRCSRRTALKSLKAAAQNLEQKAICAEQARLTARTAISTASERSNWPLSLRQLAELIERDGESAVSETERRRALGQLPRGIEVAR